MTRGLRVVIASALLVTAAGCADREPAHVPALPRAEERPASYSSDAIRARVVEAESGKPISGAAVVVLWRRVQMYAGRWDGIYILHERRTGDDGTFEVPRWGPRTLGYDAYLEKRDPEIWVLKRGYLLGYFDNSGPLDRRVFSEGSAPVLRVGKPAPGEMPPAPHGAYWRASHGGSIWNGRDLPLHRADSAAEEARALELAAPLEPYQPAPVKLPLFWSEWDAARDALPAEAREIEKPLPLTQRPRRD